MPGVTEYDICRLIRQFYTLFLNLLVTFDFCGILITRNPSNGEGGAYNGPDLGRRRQRGGAPLGVVEDDGLPIVPRGAAGRHSHDTGLAHQCSGR